MNTASTAPGALLFAALACLAAGALCFLGFLATAARTAIRNRRARRADRADRALLRLARKDPRTVPAALAYDDPQRSPDWCWTHNCHRLQCPTPDQGGH
ncbi:hypothetical protein [Streptomyces longwoodensis]|uniref:hypothetical protein n=1 Tax=Streptomyces longwoodensis TaxID=68231 RepID=UPI0036FF6F46